MRALETSEIQAVSGGEDSEVNLNLVVYIIAGVAIFLAVTTVFDI